MAVIISAVGFLLAAFIVVLNGLAFLTIATFRFLWTPSNICIASLAVSDILVGIVLASLSAVMTLHDDYTQSMVCVVCQMLLLMAFQATVLEATLVSVDRYIAVSRPYFYETHVTNRRVMLLIAVLWAVSAVTFITVLALRVHQYSSRPCVEWPLEALLAIIPPFFASIPVCGVMYALVSRIALRHQSTIAVQQVLAWAQHVPLRETFRQKMRATKLFVVVFGLHFTFWTPLVIIFVMMLCGFPSQVNVRQGIVLLACSNSCINVFVYLFLNPDFRVAFKRLLVKH